MSQINADNTLPASQIFSRISHVYDNNNNLSVHEINSILRTLEQVLEPNISHNSLSNNGSVNFDQKTPRMSQNQRNNLHLS